MRFGFDLGQHRSNIKRRIVGGKLKWKNQVDRKEIEAPTSTRALSLMRDQVKAQIHTSERGPRIQLLVSL